MKTLYLDIFSGISGDMFIGAMLDLGVSFDHLQQELRKLRLDDYHLHMKRAHKCSIEGVKFDVHTHEHGHEPHHHDELAAEQHHEPNHAQDHHHPHEHEHEHEHPHHAPENTPGAGHGHGHSHTHSHSHEHEHEHEHEHGRSFAQIRQLIQKSSLSSWVKEKAIAIFSRIAEAEGKIHGQPAEQVHFHEVGAIDSIVDIVGACVALELLGKPRVLASHVVEGQGFIQCAHGRFPIPAPATLAILAQRGIPFTQCEERGELVTPTGAAILAEFVTEFGPMKEFAPQKIGYGLGQRDNKTRPNVLRAVLGSTDLGSASGHDWETDTIVVLETNLDDSNPEILADLVERGLSAGALDVFYTPIQMKKNRPALLLSLLCSTGQEDHFSEMILRHTSALGVRRYTVERRKLQRRIVVVNTSYGPIEIKLGLLNGEVIQAAPEYESCRKLAEAKAIPVKAVYAAAIAAYGAQGEA